jgi:hypothetical protein
MPEFDENMLRNEYQSCDSVKQKQIDDLRQIIINSKELLQGNSFYLDRTLTIFPDLYNKQLNLFWCGKQALTKICEIGFNAGHSSMLMLLGRDDSPLDFTVFDIGEHSYTKPCLSYIEKAFEHVNFEYIEGDSTKTMPEWIKKNKMQIGLYDVVHVDGGHDESCIFNDMKNSDVLLKTGGIMIIDDTNVGHINKYVDFYISNGAYREMNIIRTFGYPHRILQKL